MKRLKDLKITRPDFEMFSHINFKIRMIFSSVYLLILNSANQLIF
ncbi:hypothetical protein AB8P06_06930 [Chryseobacterium sp. MD-1]